MRRKPMSYCSVVLLAASLMAVSAQGQEKQQPKETLPPARMIPGITAPDDNAHACVDCHVNMPERNMDARFSTLLMQWSETVEPGLLAKAQASAPEGVKLVGKHPKVIASTLSSIPAGCMVCHKKDSNRAPPFARMMHRIHLTGGPENHFLTIFQGECTYCHKLDAVTGQWSIPSGPEK
jgi:cytochrome c553